MIWLHFQQDHQVQNKEIEKKEDKYTYEENK